MLVIYAHPNKDGHCGAFLAEVEKRLKGSEYDIFDLYAMNYDPVLKPDEHYTSGNRKVSDENLKIQERIKREDKLILIYPIWWNGMPAILKGFFDRVFVGRFAFKYVGNIPKGLLGGRAAIFMSGGAPRIWARLAAGNRAVKVVTRDLLKFCGIRSKAYVVGDAQELSDKQRAKIKKAVDRGLKYLEA